MAEATPVTHLLLGSLVGLGLLALWWIAEPAQARLDRLFQIALAEGGSAFPVTSRLDVQAWWLLRHRLTRLQGCASLIALGLLIGAVEGTCWRYRDAWGGMRLKSWTLGLVSLACGPGLVGLLVLLPVPWSQGVVGSLGTVWALGSSTALMAGRPHVR